MHEIGDRSLLSRCLPARLSMGQAVVENSRTRRRLSRGLAGRYRSRKEGMRIPSGAIKAGEDRAATAVRELHEETGVRIDPKDLRLVMSIPCQHGQRHIYEATLDHKPDLRVDNREITYAGFHFPHSITEPEAAVQDYLSGHVWVVASRLDLATEAKPEERKS